MLKKGFTLIELLIVIGIISILITMEAFIYASSQRSARDGKRRADLENIRAALEQYKSTNDSYPLILYFNAGCTPNGALQDVTNTYMNPLPSDPYCQFYNYYYTCDVGTDTTCTSYVLGAFLEKEPVSICSEAGMACQHVNNGACNYCLGPYGTK